jgi:hypothetical protein
MTCRCMGKKYSQGYIRKNQTTIEGQIADQAKALNYKKSMFKKPSVKEVKKIVRKEITEELPRYIAQLAQYSSAGGSPVTPYLKAGSLGVAGALNMVLNITNPAYTGNIANNAYLLSTGPNNQTYWQGTVGSRPNATDRLVFDNLNMNIEFPVTPGNRYRARVMLIADKQCRGTQFNPSNILDSDDLVNSQYNECNIDLKARYRILYDKVHTFNYNTQTNINTISSGTGGGSLPSMGPEYHKVNLHCKNMKLTTDYSLSTASTVGTYQEIYSNMLSLVIITDQNFSANQSIPINYIISYHQARTRDLKNI